MYFDSLQAALLMDGHGGFVWSAYGATLLVIIVIVSLPVLRRRRTLRRLALELRRPGVAGGTQEGTG